MRGSEDGIVLSRSVRGGYGGRVRSACTVHSDGRCVVEASGVERTDALDPTQIDLLRGICDATGFAGLPDRIDTPITRTDSYEWTYRIGDREVAVRDADRADALPPALHVIDAIVEALSKEPS